MLCSHVLHDEALYILTGYNVSTFSVSAQYNITSISLREL